MQERITQGFTFYFQNLLKKRVGLLPGPGPLLGVNSTVSLVGKPCIAPKPPEIGLVLMQVSSQTAKYWSYHTEPGEIAFLALNN